MASKQKFARSENFKTPPCRVSFAQDLFKARAGTNGIPKFGCTLIFPNSAKKAKIISYDGKMVSMLDIVGKVIVDQWGEKAIERAEKGLIKLPFLAGDGKEARNKQTGELHPGMGEDVFFIRVSSNEDRPPVVRFKDPNIPATPDEVYSGCQGFAVLNAFTWHNSENGDGISFGVNYFQKTGEGDRLAGSGSVNADDWFEQVSDEGDAPAETQGGAGAGGLFG